MTCRSSSGLNVGAERVLCCWAWPQVKADMAAALAAKSSASVMACPACPLAKTLAANGRSSSVLACPAWPTAAAELERLISAALAESRVRRSKGWSVVVGCGGGVCVAHLGKVGHQTLVRRSSCSFPDLCRSSRRALVKVVAPSVFGLSNIENCPSSWSCRRRLRSHIDDDRCLAGVDVDNKTALCFQMLFVIGRSVVLSMCVRPALSAGSVAALAKSSSKVVGAAHSAAAILQAKLSV